MSPESGHEITFNNFLITGPRQIGKSTLVRKIMAFFPVEQVGGFVTEPVDRRRTAYQIRSLSDGESRIFARRIFTDQRQFKIETDVFDSFGSKILEQARERAKLIVMDEIGVMEQTAYNFQQQVLACLGARHPVLAVLKAKPNSFLAQLKARSDVRVIQINRKNRNKLEIFLLQKLRRILIASAN